MMMKIGFAILIVENWREKQARRYEGIRDMALRAEAAGFDSIWLYDHLLYEQEDKMRIGIWECWTILSALAEATERVELGTLVLCNSFRNPAILAKMAATLDEVSDGRFTLGIGAGWNKPEYDAFGLPFDHRVDRFEEALQIIRPLLRDGYVDFEGQYYQARNCQITPRGPSPNGPPLMVGSFGPRMLRLTAQYADIWNTAYLHQPESLDEPLEQMKAACDEVGRDIAALEVTAGMALGYPDLGDLSKFMEHLSGSTEEIAQAMLEYDRRGVAHLMFHVAPYQPETLDRLAEAMNLYRQLRAK
ncbi:MAG: LLM class flavin-dependent oxidoreductase [Chloroflexi bacterium]|nr:LLM class flavin-dependent oxidoreductase [Chloroflexota bacterium]